MDDSAPCAGPVAERAAVPLWFAELAALPKRRRIESQRPPRPHRAQAR